MTKCNSVCDERHNCAQGEVSDKDFTVELGWFGLGLGYKNSGLLT